MRKATLGVTPGLDARHNSQVARYGRGVKNGTLDENEQAYMKSRNLEYKATKANSKFDDGKIDREERVELHKFAGKTSLELYTLKHNQ